MKRKPIPVDIILDLLENAQPYTKPTFGFAAEYVEDKIVPVLRENDQETQGNEVWMVTTHNHHASFRKIFQIRVLFLYWGKVSLAGKFCQSMPTILKRQSIPPVSQFFLAIHE